MFRYAGGIIDVPWPKFYASLSRQFDVFNLNVLSIASSACLVTTTFYDKLLAMTMGPLFFSILIFIYFAVQKVRLLALSADLDGDGHLTWNEINIALRQFFFGTVPEPEYEETFVRDTTAEQGCKEEEEEEEEKRREESEEVFLGHDQRESNAKEVEFSAYELESDDAKSEWLRTMFCDLNEESVQNNGVPLDKTMLPTSTNPVPLLLAPSSQQPQPPLKPKPPRVVKVRCIKPHPHAERIEKEKVDLEQTCMSMFLALTCERAHTSCVRHHVCDLSRVFVVH